MRQNGKRKNFSRLVASLPSVYNFILSSRPIIKGIYEFAIALAFFPLPLSQYMQRMI
jgi:hypothetical protein